MLDDGANNLLVGPLYLPATLAADFLENLGAHVASWVLRCHQFGTWGLATHWRNVGGDEGALGGPDLPGSG